MNENRAKTLLFHEWLSIFKIKQIISALRRNVVFFLLGNTERIGNNLDTEVDSAYQLGFDYSSTPKK